MLFWEGIASTHWGESWSLFNVLQDEEGTSYLPEVVTAVIDSKGIEAIRKIKAEVQLSGEDRSAIAFYTALQYIRTPRHREESDKFMDATVKHFMRKDTPTHDDVRMSKEELLKHEPANQREEEALRKISGMSEEEINTAIFDAIHGEDISVRLTKTSA